MTTLLAPTTEGFGWLGWRVYPGLTRLDASGRRRLGRKLRHLRGEVEAAGDANERHVAAAAGVCGHGLGGQTLQLRRAVLRGGVV